MGRGNICTFGDYEGLWYVDRDYLDCYISKFENEDGEYEEKMLGEMEYNEFGIFDYDDVMSGIYFNEFVDCFVSMMDERFKSLAPTGERFGTIMENNLFEVQIEDNEWSYAVMLIQKENPYDDCLSGLQKRHYQNYLNGMKDVLLGMFPEIGCYAGAWTSGVVKRG